jgi:hypothetical protein
MIVLFSAISLLLSALSMISGVFPVARMHPPGGRIAIS